MPKGEKESLEKTPASTKGGIKTFFMSNPTKNQDPHLNEKSPDSVESFASVESPKQVEDIAHLQSKEQLSAILQESHQGICETEEVEIVSSPLENSSIKENPNPPSLNMVQSTPQSSVDDPESILARLTASKIFPLFQKKCKEPPKKVIPLNPPEVKVDPKPELAPPSNSSRRTKKSQLSEIIEIVDDAERENKTKVDAQEECETATTAAVTEDKIEESDDDIGDRRRSARIRTKKDEFSRKLKEQSEMLESSEDEDRRGRRKRANKGTDDDDAEASASTNKKKIASIFISREEKARLAAVEKERKAREQALIEQERLRQLAEERERRIQEEMKNTKQRNDDLLGATKLESEALTSGFFAARTNAKVISLLTDENNFSSYESDLSELECLHKINPLAVSDLESIHQLVEGNKAFPFPSRRAVIDLDSELTTEKGDNELKPSTRKTTSVLWSTLDYRASWVAYLVQSLKSNRTIHILDDEDAVHPTASTKIERKSSLFEQQIQTQKGKILHWLSHWKDRRSATLFSRSKKRKAHSLNEAHQRKTRKTDDEEIELLDTDDEQADQDDDDGDDAEFSIADSISDSFSEEERNDDDDEEGDQDGRRGFQGHKMRNICAIVGQTGSGKTSLVYECAKAVGAVVIEINSTQIRNAAAIKKLISEAGQSHNLLATGVDPSSFTGGDIELNGEKGSGLTILLFDEVDNYFEEEDTGFHNAIAKLALSSKSPIVLTAEKLPQSLVNLRPKICVLQTPTSEEAAIALSHANLPKVKEKEENLLLPLTTITASDLRAAVNSLSLFPNKEIFTTLPSSLPGSFSYWLLQNQRLDFALFDALRVEKESDTSTSLSLRATPLPRYYYPQIQYVFPHLIGSERAILTIQGENFLQSRNGLCTLTSDSAVAMIQVHLVKDHLDYYRLTEVLDWTDHELQVLLPDDLHDGFYSLRVDLLFDSSAIKSRPMVLSSNRQNGEIENWIQVCKQSSPVDFQKYLMAQKTKSYSSYVRQLQQQQQQEDSIEVSAIAPVVIGSSGSTQRGSAKKGKRGRGLKRLSLSKAKKGAAAAAPSQILQQQQEEEEEREEKELFSEQQQEEEEDEQALFDEENPSLKRGNAPGLDARDLRDGDDSSSQTSDRMKRKKVLLLDEEEGEEEGNEGEKEQRATEQKEMIVEEEEEEEEEGEKDKTAETTEGPVETISALATDSERIETTAAANDTTGATAVVLKREWSQEGLLQRLQEKNEARRQEVTAKPESYLSASSSSSDKSKEEGEALEHFSFFLEHLSISDCLSEGLSPHCDLSHCDEEVMTCDNNPINFLSQMESLLSEYHEQLYRYGSSSSRNLLLPPSDSNLIPPYLRHAARQRYLKKRFDYELSCFSEDCGGKRSLVYEERLPFFHLIGRSSLVYEEQEREFQRLQEAERRLKNRSCRRLQSLASNATAGENQQEADNKGPQYVYLKEVSHFQEESLKGLLELFYSDLSPSSSSAEKALISQKEEEEMIIDRYSKGEEEEDDDEEMRF